MLATQACEQHHSARYYRLGELLDELHVGHADGSYRQQLNTLAKRKLLILDDWGMEKLSARQANDLLDVMEIRYQQSSIIIASQIPTSEWYKLIPSPTIADALLDRLLHNSHRIELTGESMRKLDQSDCVFRSIRTAIPASFGQAFRCRPDKLILTSHDFLFT